MLAAKAPTPGLVDVDVAVIGAGPGGLATAIALLKQGLTVRVYERARVLRPAGSMVGVQPNGYNALRAIDPPVCDSVLGVGIEPEFFSLGNNEGKEMRRTSFREANLKRREEYGAPFQWVFWYRLQQALLKFLPEESLVLGHKLASFSEDGSGVNIHFEGVPTPVRARLLVGADGGRSLVREQLLADGQPTYTGAMTWRGSVAAADVSEFGAEPLGFYWMMGGGVTFAAVEQGDGELLWTLAAEVGWETAAGKGGDQGGGGTWAEEKLSVNGTKAEANGSAGTAADDKTAGAVLETAVEEGESVAGVLEHDAAGVVPLAGEKLDAKDAKGGEGRKARALEVMATWPERVRAVVTATAPEGVVETGVYHRAPVDKWCSKRVALVGDAAHIMRPTLGQGTSQAFEDALVLARELAKAWGLGNESGEEKSACPGGALEAYMDLRRDRVATMQLEAAEVGKTAYKDGERRAPPPKKEGELEWKLVMPY